MSLVEIAEIKSLLENEVATKKETLIESLGALEEEEEETAFLSQIAADYKKYTIFLVEQKQKQINELLGILDYLDQLYETQAITKYTLEHSKNEQKRVVKEIQALKEELDTLIAETNK